MLRSTNRDLRQLAEFDTDKNGGISLAELRRYWGLALMTTYSWSSCLKKWS
jgi:hypothetical protein